MIEIDGAFGEGGGQILRTALALSMCTGQAFRLNNIRAKRSKPGLMRQHLMCVQAAQTVSQAEVDGAALGSTAITFQPGSIQPGAYRFAISTAGSSMLVLQTVLPALLCTATPSELVLEGGTHNKMAPSYHFLERCITPLVSRLGARLDMQLLRMGFYPAGGGHVRATITPAQDGLKPFDLLDRGEPLRAYAESVAAGIPSRVAEVELEGIAQALGWNSDQLSMLSARQNEGPGNALLATLAYEHVTEVVVALGERARPATSVVAEVVENVRAYQQSTAPVGEHLADQWALLLALAVWQSGEAAQYRCTTLSPHTYTNLDVIQKFLPLRASTEKLAADEGWRVRWADAR